MSPYVPEVFYGSSLLRFVQMSHQYFEVTSVQFCNELLHLSPYLSPLICELGDL